MRKKHLQHSADILCRMFCGWRLANSYSELTQLGSGTLKIDVLSGFCRFGDDKIDSLKIARELKQWLQKDLQFNGIPLDKVHRASVVALLSMSSINSRARLTSDQFFRSDSRLFQKASFGAA